ncbi:hypothetical protein OWV82_006845 [Melia azedarach]|uniref:Uncharacterized protein n=1 Tax=Melia azedarach TaxID=155640 RepID=A0ACC1YI48_MELAZ|nr:hypothetical protein OWV82_006845 [Melia azedarach]
MTSRYYREYQHGSSSSSSSSSSFHAPQTHMEPFGGSLLLLNSRELEIARSWPEMFTEYSLLRNENRLHHCPVPLVREVVSLRYNPDNIVGAALLQEDHNHHQISPPLLMRYQAAASVRSREQASSHGFVLAQAARPASSSDTIPSLPLRSPFISQSTSSSDHNFSEFSVVDMPADDDYGTIHHRGNDEEKPPSNQTRLVETFIMMAVQTASVVGTSSNSDSGNPNFSQNAKILSYFCIACNIIGFIMFLYRIFLFGRHGEPGRAARIIGGLGYTFTAFGFIAVAAMRLHDSINFWITTACCVIAFPALARTFVV